MNESTKAENPYQLNLDQVLKYLPHRYPFVLIDRILGVDPVGSVEDLNPQTKIGVRVRGQKNVSAGELWFQGHFPGFAIFPGVLIIEAMAQTASFSLYPYVRDKLESFAKGFQCILVGVDDVRFRKPVLPGDSLVLETEVTKVRGKLWQFSAVAKVQGERVAEATLLASLSSSGGVIPA